MSNRAQIMVKRVIFQMGMVTLLASLSWVGVAIYQETKEEKIPQISKEMLTPLNPVLDATVFEGLSARRQIERVALEEIVQERESTASPSGEIVELKEN